MSQRVIDICLLLNPIFWEEAERKRVLIGRHNVDIG